MIKECKILSYNKFLKTVVFDYDGRQVQATADLNTELKIVFVKYKSGKYEIVGKSEYDKYIREQKKNLISVKATNEKEFKDM